jgi:hypothetical protein
MSTQTKIILEAVEFDDDGFMLDPNAWTPEIAEAIADDQGIQLTDRLVQQKTPQELPVWENRLAVYNQIHSKKE